MLIKNVYVNEKYLNYVYLTNVILEEPLEPVDIKYSLLAYLNILCVNLC